MKTKSNEMSKNYTKKFLSPILTYDDEIAQIYRRIFKTGMFINPDEPYTLILSVNSNMFADNVEKFEELLKEKGLFISKNSGKYYDGEVIFNIKIPDRFKHAYDMFLKGRYSSMYTEEELQKIFPTQSKTEIFLILNKNEMAITHFIDIIAQEFGTELTYEEAKNFDEYDIPPKLEEETYGDRKFDKTFINASE